MKLVLTCITTNFLLASLPLNVHSQDVHIGIEPLPLLSTEERKGYAVDMLKSIEE